MYLKHLNYKAYRLVLYFEFYLVNNGLYLQILMEIFVPRLFDGPGKIARNSCPEKKGGIARG